MSGKLTGLGTKGTKGHQGLGLALAPLGSCHWLWPVPVIVPIFLFIPHSSLSPSLSPSPTLLFLPFTSHPCPFPPHVPPGPPAVGIGCPCPPPCPYLLPWGRGSFPPRFPPQCHPLLRVGPRWPGDVGSMSPGGSARPRVTESVWPRVTVSVSPGGSVWPRITGSVSPCSSARPRVTVSDQLLQVVELVALNVPYQDRVPMSLFPQCPQSVPHWARVPVSPCPHSLVSPVYPLLVSPSVASLSLARVPVSPLSMCPPLFPPAWGPVVVRGQQQDRDGDGCSQQVNHLLVCHCHQGHLADVEQAGAGPEATLPGEPVRLHLGHRPRAAHVEAQLAQPVAPQRQLQRRNARGGHLGGQMALRSPFPTPRCPCPHLEPPHNVPEVPVPHPTTSLTSLSPTMSLTSLSPP